MLLQLQLLRGGRWLLLNKLISESGDGVRLQKLLQFYEDHFPLLCVLGVELRNIRADVSGQLVEKLSNEGALVLKQANDDESRVVPKLLVVEQHGVRLKNILEIAADSNSVVK